MEFTFRTLHCAGLAVTLENAHEFLTIPWLLTETMEMLENDRSDEATQHLEHYHGKLVTQPEGQFGGVKTTIATDQKPSTDPGIAAVLFRSKSSFDFAEIDRGKIVCVAMPQRFAVERRHVNALLNRAFYSHALRRYDRPAAERANNNLPSLGRKRHRRS